MMDHTVTYLALKNCPQCSVAPDIVQQTSAPPSYAAARAAFGERRGDRGAHENDHPRYVDPHQKQRQRGERAVDRLVRRHRLYVKREPVFGDLESERGEEAAVERGAQR